MKGAHIAADIPCPVKEFLINVFDCAIHFMFRGGACFASGGRERIRLENSCLHHLGR